MRDLRPHGVDVELGGKTVQFLFTLNAIDAIQDELNQPIFEAIQVPLQILGGDYGKDVIIGFRKLVKILANDSLGEDAFADRDIGALVSLANVRDVARAVVEAFGLSIPDPDGDEDEEDDEGDEDGAKKKPTRP